MTEKQKQYFVHLCYERGLNPEDVLNTFRFLNLPEWKAIDVLKNIDRNSAFVKDRLNAEIIRVLHQDQRLEAVKYLRDEDFAKFLNYPKDKKVLEDLLPQILSYQSEYQIKPLPTLPSLPRKGFKRLRNETKILIGLLVLFILLSIAEGLFGRKETSMPVEVSPPVEAFLQKQKEEEEEIIFDCSKCPSRCAEYKSCDFAKFCAYQCGKYWLDGDRDGRPCEWGPC